MRPIQNNCICHCFTIPLFYMNYTELFKRWVTLTTLSEDDRKKLIDKLHDSVVTTVQALAGLASSEMGAILDEAKFEKRDEYLQAVAPVAALGALDGYLLSLMVNGINPETADLSKGEKVKELADVWGKSYEKDQNISYLEKVDPIVGLLLGKISELRVNQALSFYPTIVDLPYKTTEKLHQYFGWSVHQGFVLGLIEQEMRNG